MLFQIVSNITFGSYFNQDIIGCIPNSVSHLTFGCFFDRPIKDAIQIVSNI